MALDTSPADGREIVRGACIRSRSKHRAPAPEAALPMEDRRPREAAAHRAGHHRAKPYLKLRSALRGVPRRSSGPPASFPGQSVAVEEPVHASGVQWMPADTRRARARERVAD